MPSTAGLVASGWRHPIPPLSPALWLDAADTATITASGGAVSQWDDKSGNGRHVTQGVAAAQPVTGSATLNGRNVIEFQSDYLTAAAAAPWKFMHDGTEWSTLVVARMGAVTNPNAVYGVFGTNASSGLSVGAWLAFDDRSAQSRNNALVAMVSNGSAQVASIVNNDVVTANTARVLTGAFRPSATAADRIRFSVDGGAAFGANSLTASVSTANPTYALQVGAAGNAALPLVGAIAELVIVPRLLTAAESATLVAYAREKWGI